MLRARGLQRIAEALRERTGFELPPTRMPILEDIVRGAAGPEMPVPAEELALFLRGRSAAAEKFLLDLLHEVVPRETSFFRDRNQFESLREEVLPGLLSRAGSRRPVRVLCAGCSTGEEAWSVAMLLHDLRPEAPAGSAIPEVVGVDLDRASIEVARHALYGPYSFRGVREEEKQRFFAAEEGGLRVREPIRRMARFHALNLATGALPNHALGLADLDLILCRNVLLYFDPEGVRRILGALRDSLSPGGLLMVGHAEYALAPFHGFRSRPVRQAIVHEKCDPGPAGGDPGEHAPGRQDPLAPRPEPGPWIPANLSPPGAGFHPAPPSPAPPPQPLSPAVTRARELYEQASRSLEEGDPAAAIERLERAAALDGAGPAVFHRLGWLLRESGDEEAARSAFDRGLEALAGRPDDQPVPDGDGLTVAALRGFLVRLRDRR